MTTDIIFDLLNPDLLPSQMVGELKDANARWGEPSAETLNMVVWLAMLAEQGHYTRLIGQARQRFTRELETVEGIEDAYRALPASLVLEPLHSRGLSACQNARQGAVRALKGINSQYQSNQATDSSTSPTDTQSGDFQDLHTAFMAFYRNMDEVDFQVAQVKDLGRESARLLRPLLEAQKLASDEKRAEREQLQRQVGNIRRAIARRVTKQRESDQISARMLTPETLTGKRTAKEDLGYFKGRCKELEEIVKRLSTELQEQDKASKQNEQTLKTLEGGSQRFTIDDIAREYGVTQQSASQHIGNLMRNGDLRSLGREGKKHKSFSSGEMKIITFNWPKKSSRKPRQNRALRPSS